MINNIAPGPQKVQIHQTYNFNLHLAKNKEAAVAVLSAQFTEAGHPEIFHVNMDLEGAFQLFGTVDDETLKTLPSKCLNDLFPIAEKQITEIFKNTGLGNIAIRQPEIGPDGKMTVKAQADTPAPDGLSS